MKNTWIRFGAVLVFCCAGVAGAADDDADSGPWSGAVALGYLSSSGNTDDTSTNFDFRVVWERAAWRHRLKGRAYGASSDGETTAEAYQAGWKTTYDIDENDYLFGAVDWNKDRFSGYSRQLFETVGYGRRILNDETFVLNAEIGVGYSQQKLATGGSEDGAAASLGGDFLWNFSDNASFEQTLYIFTASDNTFWESVSKLKAGLIGNVGLVLSYTIKQNTDVPPGIDKTDTLTAITIDYSF